MEFTKSEYTVHEGSGHIEITLVALGKYETHFPVLVLSASGSAKGKDSEYMCGTRDRASSMKLLDVHGNDLNYLISHTQFKILTLQSDLKIITRVILDEVGFTRINSLDNIN